MLELLKDMERKYDWVPREKLHSQLANRGWEEDQIGNAEDELFREGLIEEDLDASRLKATGFDKYSN
jgi:RIO-like serine/threonine protein kinase